MRAWWLMVALGACATGSIPHVPVEGPPVDADPAQERAYQAVLERFTRERSLYDQIDVRLFARAVWQSDDFVTARARRVASFRSLPPALAEAFVLAEREQASATTDFFLGVHAPDYRHEDFEKPGSLWRVALVVRGEERAPVDIERLGRTTTAMRSVYSFMEPFWVGYRLSFPRVALERGEVMTLRLSSALGRADLTFEQE